MLDVLYIGGKTGTYSYMFLILKYIYKQAIYKESLKELDNCEPVWLFCKRICSLNNHVSLRIWGICVKMLLEDIVLLHSAPNIELII